jgi:3',5'-cyclic AMP phosphodiesterase CpdA
MKKAVSILVVAKLIILAVVLSNPGCKEKKKDKDMFTAVFMTDIHLQYENNAVEGFKQALDTVNKLNPDFIITGGDLIMDALGQSFGRADSLYNLFQETIKNTDIPVYNTMGNHEIYGIYRNRSGADTSNPEYGEKMFEKRIGPSYYSYTHKGWKFMILNSIEDTKKDRYIGLIDADQMSWIKEELQKTDAGTPIVLSTHIPLITAMNQRYIGSTVPADSGTVVYNSKEVLDLFADHNLKLVLQGHLHTIEDIHIDGIHFITGGAVSSGWWRGLHRGFEEGFVHLTFGTDDFSWKYVDYGWEAHE